MKIGTLPDQRKVRDLAKPGKGAALILLGLTMVIVGLVLASPANALDYELPDTDQSLCFDTLTVIDPPDPGADFYGQDAQYQGLQPSYTDNGDGTVTDLHTGLMWTQDLTSEKMTWDEAVAESGTCTVGGYTDWRMPTIKELYSLILFSGTDPSGPNPVDPIPFIDTDYFGFQYGDTLSGERLIDAQYWSGTIYQGTTMMDDSTAFGVNFADGRIKGYPKDETGPPFQPFQMTGWALFVRTDTYGINQFTDNGDGTVTDEATGLMWQQADDGTGRNWLESLEYAEGLTLAGYSDWRLPNAHELQSILDYTRSMQATGSAAIDPIFSCTQITDEGGDPNYGFYWTGTTHQGTMTGEEGGFAVYVCFGEGLGWMMTPDSTSYELLDVHGAGCQRSDPKAGDPGDYPYGHGPQGDVVRIFNFTRCVRDTGTGIEEGEGGSPYTLSLAPEGPNPFSGSVRLGYGLAVSGRADISVYDLGGRRVATLLSGELPAGSGSVEWDASASPSGVYLCVLESSGSRVSTRLVLL